MSNSVKTDDVIFNFFKQICDEKDDKKCVELGNSWIDAMEKNSVDLYATVRSLYLQDRKRKINNSSDKTEAMEDGDWDTLENQ